MTPTPTRPEPTTLLDALKKCAETFRLYERLHLSKPNGQGWEKAKANAEMAEMCGRALLAASTGARGAVATKFQRGERVRKLKGYRFEGRVCGTFEYFDKDAPPMVNVQHDDGWVMHFREDDLALIAPPDSPSSQTDTGDK